MDLYFYTGRKDLATTTKADLDLLIAALADESKAANIATIGRVTGKIDTLVQNDTGEPLTLAFYDDASTAAAWVTDSDTTLAIGLGYLDPTATNLFCAVTTTVIAGSTRTATLPLNTNQLANALGFRPRCQFYLHIRKTTSGVTETVALLPVTVVAGVLNQAPLDAITYQQALDAVAAAQAAQTAAEQAATSAAASADEASEAVANQWANKTPPTGTVVGTTDTQTLTNKDLSAPTNTYRAASTSTPGAVELATVAEEQTGTDATLATTPASRRGAMIADRAFSGTALNAIRTHLSQGRNATLLQIGDSLIDGSSGYRINNYLRPAWQRIYGDGGRGYMPFHVNNIVTQPGLFAGATAAGVASNFNPATDGWSGQATASSSGMWAYSPTGTGTYKTSAAGTEDFFIVDKTRTFSWVRLWYIEHTGSGSFDFGKPGALTTVNCGGAAAVSLKSLRLEIWGDHLDDTTVQVTANSGDVYLVGIEFGRHAWGGRTHMAAVGGTPAATIAALDSTAYTEFVRTIKPTLVTINLGTNDRGSASDANLQSYLETIIGRIQAYDATTPILIQVGNASNLLSEFPTAYTAAAASTGAGLWYWRDAIGTGTTYLLGDNVHPSDQGTALLSEGLLAQFGGDVGPKSNLYWQGHPATEFGNIIADVPSNSDFTGSATNWAATGSGSPSVSIDTANDQLVIVSGASTFTGGTLTNTYFGGSLEAGSLYEVEVTMDSSDGGFWLVYDAAGALKLVSTNLTSWSAAGTYRALWRPGSASANIRILCASASKTARFSRVVLRRIYDGTRTINFASVSAGAVVENTITVRGVYPGDPIALSLPATVDTGLIWDARVTAVNTVTIRAYNPTGTPIDPASATYAVRKL